MTTTTTPTDLLAIEPLDHRASMPLAEEAYRRFADACAELSPDDWDRPTACEGWTVRDMAGHVVGAMRSAASMREQASQMREILRRAKREGIPQVDAMTAVQLERAAALSPDEVVAELHALVGPATAGRRKVPAPMRRLVRFRTQMGTIDERWTLGYLLGPILTRDAWLHRIDLADAVGAAPRLDAAHDGVIVADVAAEWARRHGDPVELVLSGPAGGRYRAGTGGPTLELDAVHFCRILSGRAEPTHPLLETAVPF